MQTMYKRLFSIIVALFLMSSVSAQTSRYHVVSAEAESTTVVKLQIKTYCQDKKLIDAEAQCAAIRAVLFDGIPNTPQHRPLLNSGESTMKSQHPSYFNSLYTERYTDFIAGYNVLSKFKKADKDKSTLYEVKVKVLALRKDIENNKIKKQFGL